jgi:anti-anti-sigma factor
VPAEELPRLFERFHRIERARSRSGEGSGIGLAMVRELVGLHGGTITAESEPDVGTTFTVRLRLGSAHLPAEHVAPAAATTGVSAAAAPFVAEALRWLPDDDPTAVPAVPVTDTAEDDPRAVAPGRVLVADDNADMREYLRRLLSSRYRVEAVPDGQAALEVALADPPDLVVSDVMMPRLDGMGLLAALRADDRTARVPVLLLSARAGQEAAVEGLAAGADDYLVKPFSARELIARVGAHLELGRVRRDAEERFRAMADLAPALIWVADAQGQRGFLNAGWREFTGAEATEDLEHRWRERLHPDDRDRYLELVSPAVAGHLPWEIEYRLRRADGAYHWLLERAVPLGGGAGFVGSCTDINARYRESQRQHLLAEVGTSLDRATGIDEQLGTLARLLVDTRLTDSCDVRRLDDDGRLRRVAIAALDDATEAVIATMEEQSDPALEAVQTRQTAVRPAPSGVPVIGSLGADPADLRRRLDANSKMAVPLVVRGRVLAVVGLGRRPESPGFTDDDRELVEEIAARSALVLDNALLLSDERASAQRLTLLQRATAALSAATTPTSVGVTASEHIRQLLGPGSEVAVYEVDPSQRVLTALLPDPGAARWRTMPLATVRPLTLAVHERRPQWFEDFAAWLAAHPDRHPELVENMRILGTAGGVALPLTAGGPVIGAIGIGFTGERRLSATERATLLALAEQCGQALDRARLYRAQQRIAETLQRNLLPQQLPGLDRLALAARYLPGAAGTQAGGDWYDVVALDETCVAIAVGDVVGQGPAAAAVMGQLRSALSTALLTGNSPAEALELLDRFAARLPGATASTAACLVLDWGRGRIRWARAGHPPPLLLSAGRTRFLAEEGAGTVLGVPGRRPYTEGTAEIEPGDVLLLYTDGLVERRSESLDEGLGRLAAAVRRHGAEAPDRLASLLLHEILADTDQPDDVALIAARLVPPPLELRLPADPAQLAGLRRAVLAWATDVGVGEDTLDDLQLAVGEAVANAVEHAYRGQTPGACTVRLARGPDGAIESRIEDFGTWRPVPADAGFRGRGLLLIRRLAEDVTVDQGPDGGTTIRFRLPPSPVRDEGPRRHSSEAPRAQGATLQVLGQHLQLAGELDLASVQEITPVLFAALGSGTGGVTIDLRGVSYLASAGIGLLLEAADRCRTADRPFRVLLDPESAPARVLGLAGLGALVSSEQPGG